MPLTSDSVVARAEAGGAGRVGRYYRLESAPGEAHAARRDFAPGMGSPARGSRICTLAHVTDLHLCDPQSPGRLEFLTRLNRGYRFRPQEMLISHATVALAETLSALPLDFCLITGDAADNAQENEIRAYLDAFDGGRVSIVGSDGEYFGVQSSGWGDSWYWRPEGGDDSFRQRWGYPTIKGFISAACRPIESAGLRHAWIACAGNHDLLFAGDSLPTEALSAIATGAHKARALPAQLRPEDLTAERYHHLLLTDPLALLEGETTPIRPDPRRRLISNADFVRMHRERESAVPGHGYGSDGLSYYRYDPVPGVRVLVLDTNHPFGAAEGSIDQRQLAWLEAETRGASGPDDPLLIVASHHASPSLSNTWGLLPGNVLETAFAEELVRIIQECPNVILWLNGHHHHNRIVAHYGRRNQFFEVTTASMTDWPTQARLLDIDRTPDGGIAITSTMVDHDAPSRPSYSLDTHRDLAGLHRELAANEHFRGNRPNLAGSRFDRNVIMVIPPR